MPASVLSPALSPELLPVVRGAVGLVVAGVVTLGLRLALRRAGLVAPPKGELDWARLLSAGVGLVVLLSLLSSILGAAGGVPLGTMAQALAGLLPAGVVAAGAALRARRLRVRADAARKSERADLEAEAVLTERGGVVAAVVIAAGAPAIGPVALVLAVVGGAWALRHPTLRPRLDRAVAAFQAGRRLRGEHALRPGATVLHGGLPRVVLGPVGLVDTRLGPGTEGLGEPELVDNVDLEAALISVQASVLLGPDEG